MNGSTFEGMFFHNFKRRTNEHTPFCRVSECLRIFRVKNVLLKLVMELDSCIPLQLATKVPIMITFAVVDKDGDPNNVMLQVCIFKVSKSLMLYAFGLLAFLVGQLVHKSHIFFIF